MNRTFLVLSSCSVVICLIVALILAFTRGDLLSIKDNVITHKETALKIGEALLMEHFPQVFTSDDVTLDAEEKSGIWRVHNVLKRQGVAENGDIRVLVGGEIYVEFRKSNGEVLNIGVVD